MPPPAAPAPPAAPDPLDVRRSILEKKAKVLTLEAQKLALEKSLRDLHAAIAADEKKLEKLPKSKAKLPTGTQRVSVSKALPDDALARQLEAVLERLDRLEKRLPQPLPPPGIPAP